MRSLPVLFVLLSTACGLAPQALSAPCLDKPATGALGACPPCQVDTDCKILSNKCESLAYCVHKDSNWTVSPRTCGPEDEHPPGNEKCVCLGNICDWRR